MSNAGKLFSRLSLSLSSNDSESELNLPSKLLSDDERLEGDDPCLVKMEMFIIGCISMKYKPVGW